MFDPLVPIKKPSAHAPTIRCTGPEGARGTGNVGRRRLRRRERRAEIWASYGLRAWGEGFGVTSHGRAPAGYQEMPSTPHAPGSEDTP